MRKIKIKINIYASTKKQKHKLIIINNFQDELAKKFFDSSTKAQVRS